jgi:hypothetical protein
MLSSLKVHISINYDSNRMILVSFDTVWLAHNQIWSILSSRFVILLGNFPLNKKITVTSYTYPLSISQTIFFITQVRFIFKSLGLQRTKIEQTRATCYLFHIIIQNLNIYLFSMSMRYKERERNNIFICWLLSWLPGWTEHAYSHLFAYWTMVWDVHRISIIVFVRSLGEFSENCQFRIFFWENS